MAEAAPPGWKPVTLSGWGRSSASPGLAARPERQAELGQRLAAAGERGIIARGGGRSYGDAASNAGGHVLLTERLDRILAFDPATGAIACEPGVTFRDLITTFLPRGFMPPASPGTAFATIGGAIAQDVHGKNHDRHGSFGDHLDWVDLLMADGLVRRVDAATDPDLLAATIGGIGLTGIIVQAGFRMLPGASPQVVVRERRIAGLEHFLSAFAEVRDSATFSVGWIDALADGVAMGRGILETAEFAPPGPMPPRPRGRTVPIDFPGFALNPLSIRLFNTLYYGRVPKAGRERVRPFAEFLYPLDAIGAWNRIYGKRGFHQFQCVLPDAEVVRGLPRLLQALRTARNASFLAVLKTLGGEGRGFLSFPMRGFTLALDIPHRAGVGELLAGLEAITLDHGGRVYLAKDSALSPAGFARMYPRLEIYRAVLARVDPHARFASDLSRRLEI